VSNIEIAKNDFLDHFRETSSGRALETFVCFSFQSFVKNRQTKLVEYFSDSILDMGAIPINSTKTGLTRLMKKYHDGADAYFASGINFKNTGITPPDYCCPRVTDIFEASA
jgi:hypothetical protein